jgi:hypothetical protein
MSRIKIRKIPEMEEIQRENANAALIRRKKTIR